jgi:predicted ATPase
VFIAAAILQVLAVPLRRNLQSEVRLLDYLRDKQMLLLLDNFEHLRDGLDLIIEMLAAAPSLKLLVTSRERLNLLDEWLIPIEGLNVPPVGGLPANCDQPELGRYSSIQLFLHYMHRLRPGFRPTTADEAAIICICQLLEGMPLAIELAATWTRTLSFSAIVDAIESNPDFLASSMHDIPERHHSLRTVFDHSWQLLSPRQREILQHMATLSGGFTPPDAAALVGATLAELAELVDRSWLFTDADGLFHMHEPDRHFCVATLNGTNGATVRTQPPASLPPAYPRSPSGTRS